MNVSRKITAEHYYDFNPSLENAPGDIWSDLPTHGLLPTTHLPGLVITPACDLAQGKVETISYLPIIPLRAYFCLPGALPELRRCTEGQLVAASLTGLISWPSAYSAPDINMLDAAEALLHEHEKSGRGSSRELTSIKRSQAGLRLLRNVRKPTAFDVDPSDIRLLLGEKEWLNTRTRLITNAFRADLHFLPADGQRVEWSGVRDHALVLFRYPMTAPIEIFECAQDISLSDWKNCCDRLAGTVPLVKAFEERRPMKRIAMKPNFISDLLTRFVSLYVRLGSPDFTIETIGRYCEEIEKSL
jgi:hypothetical protein